MRRVSIALACFRFIALPSIVITGITSLFIWDSGTPLFLIYAFWGKIITTSLMVLFIHIFLSSQFYFFNNLGYSNVAIYKNMVVIDLFIAFISFSVAAAV
jgi:hypothetical protein